MELRNEMKTLQNVENNENSNKNLRKKEQNLRKINTEKKQLIME